MAKVSENALRLMDYIKSAKTPVTAQDAATALGVSLNTITGLFNGLVRRDFGVRVPATAKMEDGTTKEVKVLKLTEDGMAYDPEDEEEDED